MNILMFVMTMIMLLTTLTYARLENYRFQALIQTDFEHYIQNVERKTFNDKAKEWYKKTVVKSKDTPSDPKTKVAASPKMSWYYLIDREAREQEPEKFQTSLNLNKQLILTLFEKQPFFYKLQEIRPNLLDELLMAIMQAIEQLPIDQRLKKVDELANLNLENPQLNDLSYKMFKGLPPLLDTKKTLETEEVPEEDLETKDTEEDLTSSYGYHSLLNYITLKNEKIRLFLASKVVLMAIVGEESVVDEIIELRKEIYRDLKNNKNKMTNQEASQQFEYMIKSQITLFDESLVDFTVTKTNPKNYE